MVDDPRQYFVEDCYALRGCLHCPDCLAFALKFYRLAQSAAGETKDTQRTKTRTLVVKFIISSIASENLPCEYALTAENLKHYIDGIFSGKADLPMCHYEFQ